MTIKGSCLCGGIQYEYTGDINEIAMCHCQQCRKAQGSAFGVNAIIDADSFILTRGEALLKEFSSSADKLRCFCSTCGSPLYSYRKSIPGKLRLRLGSLDTPIAQQVSYHAFYASKAEWYEAFDDKMKYDAAKN